MREERQARLHPSRREPPAGHQAQPLEAGPGGRRDADDVVSHRGRTLPCPGSDGMPSGGRHQPPPGRRRARPLARCCCRSSAGAARAAASRSTGLTSRWSMSTRSTTWRRWTTSRSSTSTTSWSCTRTWWSSSRTGPCRAAGNRACTAAPAACGACPRKWCGRR